MKILQILPELNSGGVERGTLEVARHLVSHGHESIVISAGGKMVAQLEKEGTRHIELAVHKKSLSSLLQVRKLRQIIETEQPDILHSRSRVPAWLSHFALKKIDSTSRPHFITTVHGFYSVNAYSRIMTTGEQVICVSNSVREYVLKNYPDCPPERLTVIHRGVDETSYHKEWEPSQEWQNDWKKAQPHLEGKFLILLPGRITRWKGHEDFIQIIQELSKSIPNCHGLVAGAPHEKKKAFYEEIRSSVDTLGLSNQITFLGHRSDMKEIMATSDIVLSLSKDPEAFGRVSLEALTLGKPVAGYSHGGVAEQLKAMLPEGGITPDDWKALIPLIQTWSETPSAPSLNTGFTLQNMLNSTMQVYAKALR